MPNCSLVVEEFRPHNFTFNYDNQIVFVEATNGWLPVWVFALYRALMAIVVIGSMAGLYTYTFLIPQPPVWTFFSFPINWLVAVACFTALYWAALTWYYWLSSGKLPRGIKLLWFLHLCSTNLVCSICFIYWLLKVNLSGLEIKDHPVTIAVHSIPFTWVVLDSVVTNIPIRFAHLVYPVGVSIALSLINLITFSLLPTIQKDVAVGVWKGYVYLSWKGVRDTLLSIFLLILMVLSVHCMLFIIHLTKMFYQTLSRNISQEDETRDKKMHARRDSEGGKSWDNVQSDSSQMNIKLEYLDCQPSCSESSRLNSSKKRPLINSSYETLDGT